MGVIMNRKTIIIMSAFLLISCRAMSKESGSAKRTVIFGLNAKTGNSSLVDLKFGASASHTDRDLEMSASAMVSRIRINDSLYSTWNAAFNADRTPKAEKSPFVFFSAVHDTMRKVDLRFQAGAGGKLTACSGKTLSRSISLALLIDLFRAAQPDAKMVSVIRWSLRPRIRYRPNDDVYVVCTIFWQPSVTDFADNLVNARIDVTSRISATTALGMNILYQYNSMPPQDTEKSDLSLGASIKLLY